jgi:anti-sigma-K factor RskA
MADLRPHSEPHPDVAGYVLGALEPDQSRAFGEHLATCGPCREEYEALAGLARLLADLPPSVALPPGLEERTFARIEQAAGQAQEPAGAGAEIVSLDPARRRRTLRWLSAAAVAVVVLAAGLGVATRLGHHQRPPLATIRLISADGGPAHGTATLRPTAAGLTIDMTVADLPPSPPDTWYTCWLVAGDDSASRPDRASVGSFFVREPNATLTVHWTTAADLAHFSRLGITREPSNGNPAHQGPKVLVSG